MTHMHHDITEKQTGWSVETRDAGTCFVPGDAVSVPSWLADSAIFTAQDTGLSELVFQDLCAYVADYVEGRNILSISVCKGYFARLSAPGYLDCTNWVCFDTIKEARDYLKDI